VSLATVTLLGLIYQTDSLINKIQLRKEKNKKMAKKDKKEVNKKDKPEKKEVVKTVGQLIGNYFDNLEKAIKECNEKLDRILSLLEDEEEEEDEEDEEE